MASAAAWLISIDDDDNVGVSGGVARHGGGVNQA